MSTIDPDLKLSNDVANVRLFLSRQLYPDL